MVAQQRQQEALSNNITNAQTPGYKADQPALRAFPELLMHKMGKKHVPTTRGLYFSVRDPIGPLNTGVYIHENIPDYGRVDIRETRITTELALVNGEPPDETGGILSTLQ